jgi:hypothetical protein
LIGQARAGVALAACALILADCSSGSISGFSVTGAYVDPSYACPVGATNVRYDLHGTINAHNGTSSAVSIFNVNATLTLTAVQGGWIQKVGDKYHAGDVNFAPTSVAAGGNATVAVTIPSSCTGRAASSPVSSADYRVSYSMTTSAGTFKFDSKDRHRILTA